MGDAKTPGAQRCPPTHLAPGLPGEHGGLIGHDAKKGSGRGRPTDFPPLPPPWAKGGAGEGGPGLLEIPPPGPKEEADPPQKPENPPKKGPPDSPREKGKPPSPGGVGPFLGVKTRAPVPPP